MFMLPDISLLNYQASLLKFWIWSRLREGGSFSGQILGLPNTLCQERCNGYVSLIKEGMQQEQPVNLYKLDI